MAEEPSALVEAVAKRIAHAEHPRKDWPDHLLGEVAYRHKKYRAHYLALAETLVRMVQDEKRGMDK